MYKSPIEVYVNDMLNQIRQQEENQIVAEVSQAVGLNVEKEELIKALNYDRNQYYKGYEDGKRASKWIPVSERLPEKNMVCLVAVGKINLTKIAVYSDLMGTINHKIFWRGDYGHENFRDITEYVKAWMPLPEPYKEGEEENE